MDIGPKMAYRGSGLNQKFYCILLLPTSGGISQLVYSPLPPFRVYPLDYLVKLFSDTLTNFGEIWHHV